MKAQARLICLTSTRYEDCPICKGCQPGYVLRFPARVVKRNGEGWSKMFIVKYKCRFKALGGQFPPVPREMADRLVARLSKLCPDYEYWIELSTAAEA